MISSPLYFSISFFATYMSEIAPLNLISSRKNSFATYLIGSSGVSSSTP